MASPNSKISRRFCGNSRSGDDKTRIALANTTDTIDAIILAAGESTRLKSKVSKVLHPVAGKPCLAWVLQAVRGAGIRQPVVVLGKQADQIKAGLPEDIKIVKQDKPLGTGHAVRMAAAASAKAQGLVLVLCGDAPLIQAKTLKSLIRVHQKLKAKATILTTLMDNPFGYGRILRDAHDARWVGKIVEEKEATAGEKTVREINSGAYCFSQDVFWPLVKRLKNNNQKGEFYLTDIIDLLNAQGHHVAGLRVEDPAEVHGINTRQDLATAGRLMNERIVRRWLDQGVTISDPQTTWIDGDVVIGQDTVILPGCFITGRTVIGPDCVIGPYTVIKNSRIGREVTITQSVVGQSKIGDQVKVGPFAHLRSGNTIAGQVKIGNFAELNRSTVKTGTKVGHVSYIGDTVLERQVNIGAGTITANYDGQLKHRTRVGRQAFIGSGTVLVAPNRIGRQAVIGAGAVVKANTRIPAGSVAVGIPARVIKKKRLLDNGGQTGGGSSKKP